MDSEPLPAGPPALPRRFVHGFAWRVGWRFALLAALLAATVWAALPPTLPAATAVFAATTLLLGHGLWREVRRTNLALARLLSALHHRDHGERFASSYGADAGFAELAQAFDTLLARQQQALQVEVARHTQLLAVLEHVPTPLVAVDDAERVSPLNLAARRLLGPFGSARVADLAAFGDEFVALLQSRDPAPAPATVTLRPSDDAGTRLRVARSEALLDGRMQRLFALQPIQAELDDAEARLASGLVRVLTHEVMNSLTPVSSLLRTASDLAARLPAPADGAATADTTDTTDPARRLGQALATAARRSEGLLAFVERYRALARPPAVHKAPLPAAPFAEALAELFRAEWPAARVALDVQLPHPAPELHADRAVLEPLLLNVLRNAAQAAVAYAREPRVRLALQRAPSGRVLIDVDDNGPGIPPALREEVFLPFFTTKPDGHGVGLALARQGVLAHGGSIEAEASSELGGARVRIAL